MTRMIATRTMSIMVTMALLGVVPAVAHAQQVVDLDQLVTQSGTPVLNSEPAQVQTQELSDTDTNTNTLTNQPINFAIVAVGPFNTGTASSDPALGGTPVSFVADDSDTNTNLGTQTQDAPASQSLTQAQGQEQSPAFPVSSVNDIVTDLFPAT
jgi:hypothetical protein